MSGKDELQRRLDEVEVEINQAAEAINKLQEDVEALPEPEPIPNDYVPGNLPIATREITIDSSNDLIKALGNAEPGNHFILRPGEYGEFTADRNGTKEQPICIVGSDDVIFTGINKLVGDWVGIYNSKFRGNGRRVDASGNGNRISRCLFPDINNDGIVYCTGNAHPNFMLDYCSFIDIIGAAFRCELEDATKHQNMHICYNYINGHSVKGENESVMLVLTDAYDPAKLVYEYNLFNDCLRNFTNQKELISIKTGDVTVRGCTLTNSRGGFICLRETRRCLIEGNWLRDGSFINVHGDDHIIRNNNSDSTVAKLVCGNATFDTPLPDQCKNYSKAGRTPIIIKGGDCKTAHTATRRTLIEHNIGTIKLGEDYPDLNYKVVDITLRNNQKAATRVANSFENVVEESVGQNNTTAFQLTPEMVGWKGIGLPIR